MDGVFPLRASVNSDRKLTKTLLCYVAPTQKYVKRVIYFSLFLAMQAPKPEKMRAFHRKVFLNVFAVENGVSRSCTFRFRSGDFELPTVHV